jgi:hypothetical protein
VGEAADTVGAECATGCALTLPLLSGQTYEIQHEWQAPGAAKYAGEPAIPVTSYWSMDEASGDRVDSAAAHDLTPSGSPTTVTGIFGNAVELDEPSATQFLTAPRHADLIGGDVDLSVAMWVKPGGPTFDQSLLIGPSGEEWKLFVSGFGSYTNYFRFSWQDDDVDENWPITITDAPLLAVESRWTFVVAWRDNTAKTISLQVDHGPIYTTSSTVTFTGDNDFGVGGFPSAPSKEFDGVIDEVYLYRGIWTDQEKLNISGLATIATSRKGTVAVP